MRQYRIVTKTPDSKEQLLRPTVHASLYNIPEIRSAVEYLDQSPHVEMIGIRMGVRFYGIVMVEAEDLKDDHFQLRNFDA